MWDYKSIVPELEKAGFINIRRAHFGDSEINAFSEVESLGRWENCLGVQAKKGASG